MTVVSVGVVQSPTRNITGWTLTHASNLPRCLFLTDERGRELQHKGPSGVLIRGPPVVNPVLRGIRQHLNEHNDEVIKPDGFIKTWLLVPGAAKQHNKELRFAFLPRDLRATRRLYLPLNALVFTRLLVVPQVQVDRGLRLDRFTELPVSLVLVSLICVDITERIRSCRLIGQCKS